MALGYKSQSRFVYSLKNPFYDKGILQTVDKAQGSRLGFFVKRAIKLPFFRIL